MENNIISFISSLDGFYSPSSKARCTIELNLGYSDQYTALYSASVYSLLGYDDKAVEILNNISGVINFGNFKYIDNAVHSEKYTELHALPLLWALEVKYIKKLNYQPAIWMTSEDTLKELCSFTFEESWRDSNIILGLASNLVRNELLFDIETDIKVFWKLMGKYWSKTTGLIEGSKNISLLNSICGTFHLIPIYKYYSKELPFPNELANSILKFNNGTGYPSLPGGFVCLDLDILHIIDYLVESELDQSFLISLKEFSFLIKEQISNSRNNDFGWGDELLGFDKDLKKNIYYLTKQFTKTRCSASTMWSAKKVLRRTFYPNKVRFANSIIGNGALADESNIFATWFRLLALRNDLGLNKNIPCFPTLGY